MDSVFWLSFCGPEGFRGGCFIEACSFESALQVSHVLGINPGGEVLSAEIPKTSWLEGKPAGTELGVLYSFDSIPGGAVRMVD